MKTRPLGTSGLDIATLVLGSNVFGWTVDEKTSFELLDAFVDAGFNCIDTADAYSKWVPGNKGGESETIIGKWLKQSGKRKQVIIATKVGWEISPDQKGLSKKYILRAIEASLTRLQTDYIDLYQAHIDDANTPLEETLAAFNELVQAGKVRVIGASNYDAPRLQEALKLSDAKGYSRFKTLQPLYNLYDRAEYEKHLEPLCLTENIGVICYFSLASGFLTGKYRSENDFSKSARGLGMKKFLNPRGFKILEALDKVAKTTQATPAQVALAWLIARPSVTAPIASATNLTQLKELIAGTTLQLEDNAVDLLNTASAWLGG